MSEKQFDLDMVSLMRLSAFKRFLWRVIQDAGLLERNADGSDGRDRYRAGRRDLGLDILDLAERGQPVQDLHPNYPLLTIIQTLIEETQKSPEEKSNVRSPKSYDRTADVLDEDEPDAS